MTEAEALSDAREFTQKTEGEGLVLLKNDGTLPLTGVTKVNVFGNCSYQNLYQGSGSASSWFKQDLNVNLKSGLENAGFEVNPGLWKFYEDHYRDRNDQAGGTANMTGADASIFEQSMETYGNYNYNGQDILSYSESYSDTAIVVFGRAGGEGGERKNGNVGSYGRRRGQTLPRIAAARNRSSRLRKGELQECNSSFKYSHAHRDGLCGRRSRRRVHMVRHARLYPAITR